jgi:DNA-directed RNA polymerase subunit M/transcription elongation factor TFIIS
MKFCEKCDNMYYISINAEDPNKLVHYCRNCKFIDDSIIQEGGCIIDVQTKNDEQHINRIINKYTKNDPTLPRVYNMKCPNNDCNSNKSNQTKNPEVVYLRYEDDNMKYLYICTECDNTWKTNQIV